MKTLLPNSVTYVTCGRGCNRVTTHKRRALSKPRVYVHVCLVSNKTGPILTFLTCRATYFISHKQITVHIYWNLSFKLLCWIVFLVLDEMFFNWRGHRVFLDNICILNYFQLWWWLKKFVMKWSVTNLNSKELKTFKHGQNRRSHKFACRFWHGKF